MSALAGKALVELAEALRGEDSVISSRVGAPGAVEPALGTLAGAGPRATLALLAGDYLYALGLERLAALGDLEAVRELSDLISLAAQVHDGSRDAQRVERESSALWLASVTAIGAGSTAEHESAKGALRDQARGADTELWRACSRTAAAAGLGDELGRAADAIDFAPDLST